MALIRLLLALVFLAPSIHGADWEVFENVTLPPETSGLDGDSVPVEILGGRIMINLYFVDAAETASDGSERVVEQMAHWGLDAAGVAEKGGAAKERVRELLEAGPFTVHTRRAKISAFGGGERWYGMIQVGDRYLSEILVEEELARVKGRTVTPPDGRSATDFVAHLEAIEGNPQAAGTATAPSSAPPSAPSAAPSPVAGGAPAATADVPVAATPDTVTTTNPSIVYTAEGELKKIGVLPAGRVVDVLGEERFFRVRIEVPGKEPVVGLIRANEL